MEAPILAYPYPTKEYIMDTDASDHSVGAILSQVQGGSDVVVAYYSKTLPATEKSYCTTKKELLALVKVVKHFWQHLYVRTLYYSATSVCRYIRTRVPSSSPSSWETSAG